MNNKHCFYKKPNFEFALRSYVFINMENNMKNYYGSRYHFESHNNLRNRVKYFAGV